MKNWFICCFTVFLIRHFGEHQTKNLLHYTMKYIVSTIILFCLMVSCKKNDFLPHDDFYLQMKVNGQPRVFGRCAGFPGGTGGGQFECTILDGTDLFIVAGCGGNASFFIRNANADGDYVLNGHNIASVSAGESAYNNYTTDSLHTGTLTIEKIFFKNRNCLKGSFYYSGIDTSGTIGKITEGSFLMPFGA